jgi:hypothetical protein
MKSFYDSFIVGTITTSTLILGNTTSYIFGGYNCSEYYNDWKVFGVVASMGALCGSYYVKSNN